MQHYNMWYGSILFYEIVREIICMYFFILNSIVTEKWICTVELHLQMWPCKEERKSDISLESVFLLYHWDTTMAYRSGTPDWPRCRGQRSECGIGCSWDRHRHHRSPHHHRSQSHRLHRWHYLHEVIKSNCVVNILAMTCNQQCPSTGIRDQFRSGLGEGGGGRRLTLLPQYFLFFSPTLEQNYYRFCLENSRFKTPRGLQQPPPPPSLRLGRLCARDISGWGLSL